MFLRTRLQQGAHRSRPQRVLVARPLNTPGIVELLRDGQEAGACYRILLHMVSIDWRARLAGAERLDDLILGRQEANDNLISRYFNDGEFRNLLTDAILAFAYQQAREPESPVKAAAD